MLLLEWILMVISLHGMFDKYLVLMRSLDVALIYRVYQKFVFEKYAWSFLFSFPSFSIKNSQKNVKSFPQLSGFPRPRQEVCGPGTDYGASVLYLNMRSPPNLLIIILID